MNDEEFEFEDLDEFYAMMKEAMGFREDIVSVIDPSEIKKVSETYEILKHMTRGIKDVKISCEVNEPRAGFGSISVIGKKIAVNNPEMLVQAAKIADSFEVYSKLDGTVHMNFSFNSLTVSAEM